MTKELEKYIRQIRLPKPESHKGQNGKLLIIGGSELFHAASKWSLDVASKFVDMVFYASVPSNNALMQEAKGQFWNGIVVSRENLEPYLQEANCILIGPGMERSDETAKITNELLAKYPEKKWVIDAGALQMIDPRLLTVNCIVTPHKHEFTQLCEAAVKAGLLPADTPLLQLESATKFTNFATNLLGFSHALHSATILRKAPQDLIIQENLSAPIVIEGGNAGMTKGGTGDVLAGLVAGLYCTNDALSSAVVASYINKKAGESLYKKVGPYFNASDLVAEIPSIIWNDLR